LTSTEEEGAEGAFTSFRTIQDAQRTERGVRDDSEAIDNDPPVATPEETS